MSTDMSIINSFILYTISFFIPFLDSWESWFWRWKNNNFKKADSKKKTDLYKKRKKEKKEEKLGTDFTVSEYSKSKSTP